MQNGSMKSIVFAGLAVVVLSFVMGMLGAFAARSWSSGAETVAHPATAPAAAPATPVTPAPNITGSASTPQKPPELLEIRTARAELARWYLINQIDLKFVDTATKFHNLNKARYDAGQVTGLDVANAALALKTRELELRRSNSKLSEAKESLDARTSGESDAVFKSAAAVNFSDNRPGLETEIRSDAESASVLLLTKKAGEKETAAAPLFRALRVQDSEVARLLDKAAPAERPRMAKESRAALAAMREIEAAMMLEGDRVEYARRAAEAARISFERGLQSSFDVDHAEEALLKMEVEFIEKRAEYEIQFATLESLLGGAVYATQPEPPTVHARSDGF